MDDWAWDDPAELRIRLDVALEHNAMLAAEIAELQSACVSPAHISGP